MNGQQTCIKEISETIKTLNGVNYAEITATYNTHTKTYFGCNCSFFDTELEVIAFVKEVFHEKF